MAEAYTLSRTDQRLGDSAKPETSQLRQHSERIRILAPDVRNSPAAWAVLAALNLYHGAPLA